jgi:hypothetical protein
MRRALALPLLGEKPMTTTTMTSDRATARRPTKGACALEDAERQQHGTGSKTEK